MEAREAMVNAIFLGGMAFNDAGLGYVHAMAHQLDAVYHLPNGVCLGMLAIVKREDAKHVPEVSVVLLKDWCFVLKLSLTKSVPIMLFLKSKKVQ